MVLGLDGLAVHADEAPADHRKPVELAHAGRLQRAAEGLALFGLDVDDEAIRRIGGVAARQLEMRSVRSSTSRINASRPTLSALTWSTAKPAREATWRVAISSQRGTGSRGITRASVRHGQPRAQREDEHRGREAADGDATQLGIPRHGQQQQREAEHTGADHQPRDGIEVAQFAPEHAQRRHPGELQHRRQPEARHQRGAHPGAEQRGPDTGRRQVGLDDLLQQGDEAQVDAVAQAEADDAGDEPDEGELDHVRRGDRALRRHPARAAWRHRRDGATRSRANRWRPPPRPAAPRATPPGSGTCRRGRASASSRAGPSPATRHARHAALARSMKLSAATTKRRTAASSPVGEATARRYVMRLAGCTEPGGRKVVVVQHHARREGQKPAPRSGSRWIRRATFRPSRRAAAHRRLRSAGREQGRLHPHRARSGAPLAASRTGASGPARSRRRPRSG